MELSALVEAQRLRCALLDSSVVPINWLPHQVTAQLGITVQVLQSRPSLQTSSQVMCVRWVHTVQKAVKITHCAPLVPTATSLKMRHFPTVYHAPEGGSAVVGEMPDQRTCVVQVSIAQRDSWFLILAYTIVLWVIIVLEVPLPL